MYAQARSRLSVLKEERRVAEKAAATIQAAWEGHKGRCLARARVKERAEADALYLEQESQELAARVIQRAITAWLSERRFTWRLKMSAIRSCRGQARPWAALWDAFRTRVGGVGARLSVSVYPPNFLCILCISYLSSVYHTASQSCVPYLPPYPSLSVLSHFQH